MGGPWRPAGVRPSIGIILGACLLCSPAWAQDFRAISSTRSNRLADAAPPESLSAAPNATHPFWDRANLELFAGVAAVRFLDFTSTQHFRERGRDEVLLSNNLVDNKPLYASIEGIGVAASIGLAYWLHRTGHHRLERLTSIAHIGVASVGDTHNYLLRRRN